MSVDLLLYESPPPARDSRDGHRVAHDVQRPSRRRGRGRQCHGDSPRRVALDDTLPFAVALIPFGLAVGGTSAAIGLSGIEAVFGAIVLLAGAGQLAALDVMGSGGGTVSVVVIAALVNLRFVFYGAGVAAWFADRPLRTRLMLAFPIVDQTFMLCQRRFADRSDPAGRRRYYLTATALLAGVFVSSQVVGFNVGANMPAGLGLHLAAPLVFAGMLATSLSARRDTIAAGSAALVVIGGTEWAGAVTLPMAVAAGVLVATRAGSRPTEESSPTTEAVETAADIATGGAR